MIVKRVAFKHNELTEWHTQRVINIWMTCFAKVMRTHINEKRSLRVLENHTTQWTRYEFLENPILIKTYHFLLVVFRFFWIFMCSLHCLFVYLYLIPNRCWKNQTNHFHGLHDVKTSGKSDFNHSMNSILCPTKEHFFLNEFFYCASSPLKLRNCDADLR